MLGNLILAGSLPTDGFGRLALFQAILGLGAGLGPLGLDTLVVRRELPVSRSTLRWSAGAGTLMAGLAAVVAAGLYAFDVAALLLLGSAVLAGTILRMCAASLQAAVLLGRAQLLTQLPFVLFGMGAFPLALAGVQDWRSGALLLTGGYLAAGLLGIWLLDRAPGDPGPEQVGGLRREWVTRALAFVGLLASVLLLHQLERLVVGGLLGLEELGIYAVVATVVASPYRALHGGIGYALMPRLRAESDPTARRRLVRDELRLAALLGLGGGVVMSVLARPVIVALYGTKYPVGLTLVVVIVAVGILRLFYGVAAATLSALAGSSRLRAFNWLGWLSVAVAVAGAVGLSGLGLVGVVAGVGAGWTVRLVAAAALARPLLAGQEAAGG